MPSTVPRSAHLTRVLWLLDNNPAVTLIGARQVGKTTLALQIADTWPGPTHTFDLERASDIGRLAEPELALERLDGLIILDEIQRRPDLFPALRALIDRNSDRRFLILRSASPDLLRQSSETLAGRIAFHHLPGFASTEVGTHMLDRLWVRGGFPRSFLADDDETSFEWRLNFIRTFVERDLPALRERVAPTTHDRFWRMLAHVHGRTWNGSRFASSFGVSDKTVRSYLDTLSSALVVRQLRPWFENVSKRQVKSPKVYIADSGLLHALLDLQSRTELERHPVLGASWEGFVLTEVMSATGARTDQQHFWATHEGAELDLLLALGARRIGIEIKRTTTPKVTRSLRSAIDTLHLDAAYIIHAGDHSFPLSHGVEAVAATDLTGRTW